MLTDEKQVNDGNGPNRFVRNKAGHLIDREMHPKVVKAQAAEQKRRATAKRRSEQ